MPADSANREKKALATWNGGADGSLRTRVPESRRFLLARGGRPVGLSVLRLDTSMAWPDNALRTHSRGRGSRHLPIPENFAPRKSTKYIDKARRHFVLQHRPLSWLAFGPVFFNDTMARGLSCACTGPRDGRVTDARFMPTWPEMCQEQGLRRFWCILRKAQRASFP